MTPRLSLLHATLALAFLIAPAVMLAQANRFDLIMEGKKIGSESYTLAPAKGGYALDGKLNFRVAGADGDFVSEFKFGEDYSFIDGTITDQATRHRTTLVPNKAHNSMTVTLFQGAGHNPTIVDIKPNLVILPPFDPGAAQAILLLATTHPTADSLYNLFVPVPGGGGGGGGRRGGGAAAADTDASAEDGTTAHDARWFKGKDSGGTLDGKPVLLHTYMLAYGKSRYIFYADDSNTLMLMNVPAIKATYIRSNFKLNAAPPSAAAPPAPALPRP